MIEGVSEIASLVVMAACFGLALARAWRKRSTAWVTLALFFGCMLLGDVYWLGYLAVFDETPRYSRISELSWVAAYAFLLMTEIEADRRRAVSAPVRTAWVPVVLCAAFGTYFIATFGSPLLNIADEGLLAAAGFFAVRGFVAKPTDHAGDSSVESLAYNRRFHAAVLAFILVEQALWLASCFLDPGPIETVNAYIVLNYVLALSIAAILACAWKSDDL